MANGNGNTQAKSTATPAAASNSAPGPDAGGNAGQRTQSGPARKRKGHRGGKKKRQRRKSFAILDEGNSEMGESSYGPTLYQIPSGNLSGTSLDSEALLDHREHQPMRVRRTSTVAAPQGVASQSPFGAALSPFSAGASRLRSVLPMGSRDDDAASGDETSPLLADTGRHRGSAAGLSGYGANDSRTSRPRSRRESSKSSRTRLANAFGSKSDYDINHPPSVPGSPTFGSSAGNDMNLGDVMIRDEIDMGHSISGSVAGDNDDEHEGAHPDLNRRPGNQAEEDVCFPGPGMSELGEEDFNNLRDRGQHQHRTRRRRGEWPDLSILEEWHRFEKEGRSDVRRVKKITEPQLINGRLRPVRRGWYQTDEDAPYRFTYFNEEFQSTIHSQTISELVQPGTGFRELFIPDPRILSDDESDLEEVPSPLPAKPKAGNGDSKISTRQTSVSDNGPSQSEEPSKEHLPTIDISRDVSGRATPSGTKSPPDESASTKPPAPFPNGDSDDKANRAGERPVWWLDVLCPTEAEMKVIAKAFGIHPLTAEDIMLQEAREKVELFRHYYFINYRTFDQDSTSDNFLEPVDMYVIVFREGVLSFHFSMTPHPANVRRRIRQLRDYLILSSDWISYAIIDDITDVFQPLIGNIEDEVDEIDDAILRLHSVADKRLKNEDKVVAQKHDDATTVADSTGDMLLRVGDCRKRVMSLYRLLGNKADVIKGFAKRCNERWEVAPRSEIGLYLGDIQDHIITMTSSLGHYEKILARSHGNYLAQINIRMNERQEQTADVLGKLTVLGTIVLPMNIITGLWGMNVWVPGQEYEGDLVWFFCITGGLLAFGIGCYLIAKRVYNIV
ncbi:corA-like mg2+ transporter protein [Sarocladium implicatum]|nr:corA-like mg2+ transporter protein [Sarocladium implicatum]